VRPARASGASGPVGPVPARECPAGRSGAGKYRGSGPSGRRGDFRELGATVRIRWTALPRGAVCRSRNLWRAARSPTVSRSGNARQAPAEVPPIRVKRSAAKRTGTARKVMAAENAVASCSGRRARARGRGRPRKSCGTAVSYPAPACRPLRTARLSSCRRAPTRAPGRLLGYNPPGLRPDSPVPGRDPPDRTARQLLFRQAAGLPAASGAVRVPAPAGQRRPGSGRRPDTNCRGPG
jgi:hypothetical protein